MLAVLSLSLLAAPTPATGVTAFAEFKAAYQKTYLSSKEEALRLAAFAASLREIDAINRGALGWTAGLNQYSDLTWLEFKQRVLMAPQNCSATRRSGGRGPTPTYLSAPPAIDWRDFKALNAVKNQQSCGSCWTFSTTGCLEAHTFLKTGVMTNISEQQLVDCAGAFNNQGCNGGLPSQAFEYIMFAGGIDSEQAYPYTAKTGACVAKKAAGITAKVHAVVNITAQDEGELLSAVGTGHCKTNI